MPVSYCFRPQRYKILKPIHNPLFLNTCSKALFQTTKIQNFETNSQHDLRASTKRSNCFRPQRYKILKPIHNCLLLLKICVFTVSDHKDTKFWNQFTTVFDQWDVISKLFQTTKIQNFETNSQHGMSHYEKLKTVSDHKDTKFWNQFTTLSYISYQSFKLFQTTKIQNFETNSQQKN